jgi:hypothetical protein
MGNPVQDIGVQSEADVVRDGEPVGVAAFMQVVVVVVVALRAAEMMEVYVAKIAFRVL